VSFGVSRSLIPLLADGVLAGNRSVPSAVLVALVDEESRPLSDAVADALRARAIPCEVAATPQKFGKQIRYAERRGIPWVWFPGDPHEVKDIRSGNQVEADPRTWEPPSEDLHPTIKISTGSTTEEKK
jgi:histidyl-tRNA synthetase